jgi:ABC-type bacteriocin/lantibiotic exporter with double-glycine peptidase domain
VILFNLDAAFRLAFSFLIVRLFRAVVEGDMVAYIYVPILAVLWYISQLFKHLALLNTYLLSEQIKSGYAMLIYAKLSKLTSYVLNEKLFGKVSNLIANDLAVIEQRTTSLLSATSSPLMLVGITVILYIRIGWPCLLAIAFILLMVPLIRRISKISARILKEANEKKDVRVQLSAEMVEGIKYIKLNGWEIAFHRLVAATREDEISVFRNLAVARSLERALGNSIGYMAAIIMLGVASMTTGISVALIFSVLEMASLLKANVLLVVLSLGLYYETTVVLGRFAVIFNIEALAMIKKDEAESSQADDSETNNRQQKV